MYVQGVGFACIKLLERLIMRQYNHIRNFFVAGILVCGFCACGDDGSSSDPIVPQGGQSSSDTTIVVKPNGDTTVDVKKPDTIRTINDQGDTITVIDTIYESSSDTLHWVGNSALRITEITPINLTWLDESGSDPAWVEIYNAGDQAANLKGYALVENLNDPRKWVFGDELIAAKSFRIVFCDKKNTPSVTPSDNGSNHARTHTNWKMDKSGGSVYLIDSRLGIRDSVQFPEITVGDVSWGITDGGIWKYFDKPTPEAPNTNSNAYDNLAPALDLSQLKGGFYNDPVTINPPSLPSGVKLRCTQDGSIPTKNSQEFNSPITISKSGPLRCSVFKDGALTTQVVTKTFFIGESVAMPVVAVSVNPEFFQKAYIKTSASNPDGAPAGLYEDQEFPVHVEYFPKGSASDKSAWDIEAGISLMGGWSRLNNKKSVAIAMHEEYQDGRLKYPLFETRKSDSVFKAFNLRNNGNRYVSDYIADAVAGAVLEGSHVDYQRSRQVVVFYNGEYYGIHDMRERYNRGYVQTNYGIDDNTVEMVKHLGSAEKITASGDGSIDNYLSMLQFVGNNDMSVDANYEAAKALLDVANYADYMIAEIYFHNGDWPNNNVRAWRSPEQPWKFMVYDVDHGFDWMWGVNGGEFSQSNNMFAWIKKGGGNKPCKDVGCFANLYTSLMKNENFKRLFLNHTTVMWQHYLNASNFAKVIDNMVSTLVDSEMDRDLEKFHQAEQYYQNSCGHGFDRKGSCLKEWTQARDSKVLEEYQEEFGVGSTVSMTISSNGNGSVLMEGMVLPGSTSTSTKYTGKFFSGLNMELTAVPAAGSVFTGWSDGSTDNPHLVPIAEGSTITANFK